MERVASRLGQASEYAFRSGAMGPGEALSDLIASSRELEREIASAITDLPADKQQERAVLDEVRGGGGGNGTTRGTTHAHGGGISSEDSCTVHRYCS